MSEQKRAERILSTHNGSKPGLKNHDEKGAGRLRVLSWNLLRLTGATVEDVAALVRAAKPDLLLLQEATKKIETLPELVGGHFFREPLPRRIYGLAAWLRGCGAARGDHYRQSRPLPAGSMPGARDHLPPRADPARRLFRSSPHPSRPRGDGGSTGAARPGGPAAARAGGDGAESSLRQDRPALHRGKAG